MTGNRWNNEEIELLNPDFVNCNSKKIAVEVFGNYWHDKARRETEYGRSRIVATFWNKCL